MVCTYCRGETEVINSRPQKRSNQVWRRRRCKRCLAVFTTLEAVDLAATMSVETNGRLRPFLSDLLYTEVLLSLSDRKNAYIEAREVVATIIKQLQREPNHPLLQSTDISRAAAKVLQRFDKRAWHRYAAEHPSLQA